MYEALPGGNAFIRRLSRYSQLVVMFVGLEIVIMYNWTPSMTPNTSRSGLETCSLGCSCRTSS